MTTAIIILSLVAAIILFISRALYNWRKRNAEAEATKRLEDRLEFRKERWDRMFIRRLRWPKKGE